MRSAAHRTPARGSPTRHHAAPAARTFEVAEIPKSRGTFVRLLITLRHLGALLVGALASDTRRRTGFRGALRHVIVAPLRALLRPEMRTLPFAAQFRRRLELLGPTYIKLGQILSLREDILPAAITEELRNLLDRLPVVPFRAIMDIVEHDLDRPASLAFASVDPEPIGSASIAQIHRATTLEGDDVVIKVVKPGIRDMLHRDARILRTLGRLLELVFARYQPRRIIAEFCDYTLREVDLRREADNAETFASNFHDRPDIVFPRIYRQYSGRDVLCMEFMDGIRPDTPKALALPLEDRTRLVDLGAEAIICMLYRDGVFHADLHPGNLVILENARVGFIDLGMVGRLDGDLRRALLFYYYSLVSGEAEAAARYLAAVAVAGPRSDPAGFRREVTEISSRWHHNATFEGFSLARLILESVQRGGQYYMYFPVELVLMVKALITFEGVGHVLLPGFDIAAVSRRHIRSIFLSQFSPIRVVTEGARSAPDLLEAAIKIPLLITEGLRVLDQSMHRRAENPLAGVRGTLVGGFSLVAAAILMAFGTPWPVWTALFLFALVVSFRRGG